jgi:Mg/Co/Ni transporter MgtE
MSASLALVESYLAAHPQDAARSVERLPVDDLAALLAALSAEAAGALIAHVAPAAAVKAVERLPVDEAARRLAHLGLAQLAPLLRRLDPIRGDRLLDELPADRARPARALLAQAPDTAGAVMDPEILTLPLDASVADARALIAAHPEHLYYYLYVVDADQRLAGVIDVAELTQAEDGPVRAVMNTTVVSLPAAMPLKAVFAHAGWRDFDALPVVGDDRRFLGAIRHRRMRQLVERDRAGVADDRGMRTVLALGEVYWLGLCGLLQGIATAAGEPASGGRS